MTDNGASKAKSDKPATAAEYEAGAKSTKDGLQKTRGNSQTRAEVQQQKTQEGQPNRG
jgi:hypothetical protein